MMTTLPPMLPDLTNWVAHLFPVSACTHAHMHTQPKEKAAENSSVCVYADSLAPRGEHTQLFLWSMSSGVAGQPAVTFWKEH